MPIKDALEVLIKIFHRNGTQFMENASYLDAIIGVGVASIRGGHEQAVILLTEGTQLGRVVMAVA